MSELTNDKQTTEVTPRSPKKRLGILLGSLAGIVVLIVLAAIFLKQPIKVHFVLGNLNSIDPIIVEDGKLTQVPNDPRRHGYDFAGWTYQGETNVIEDLANEIFDKTVYLYAKWLLHKYTITYELDGGSLDGDLVPLYEENADGEITSKYAIKHEIDPDSTDSYDEELLRIYGLNGARDAALSEYFYLPTPVNGNRQFLGWYTSSDFAAANQVRQINNRYVLDQVTPKDITLYARWA